MKAGLLLNALDHAVGRLVEAGRCLVLPVALILFLPKLDDDAARQRFNDMLKLPLPAQE